MNEADNKYSLFSSNRVNLLDVCQDNEGMYKNHNEPDKSDWVALLEIVRALPLGVITIPVKDVENCFRDDSYYQYQCQEVHCKCCFDHLMLNFSFLRFKICQLGDF